MKHHIKVGRVDGQDLYLHTKDRAEVKVGPMPDTPGRHHRFEFEFEEARATPDPDPDPPTGDGMAHKIDGRSRARVIGYGPYWFANSRLIHDLNERQVREWVSSREQAGMTHMWVSLSTAKRSKMNEVPFHPLQHQQAVKDRLDLLISLNVQPVPFTFTQEYLVQFLRSDVSRASDYCQQVAEIFCPGRCKIAVPTREMTDHEAWGGGSGDERVAKSRQLLKALARGAGESVGVGIHLPSLEPPPTAIAAGVPRPYWLMQFPFAQDVSEPFSAKDDDHRPKDFDDGADWLEYWAVNRAGKIPGIKTIAFEHSLPDNTAGYKGHTLEEAVGRGMHFLGADHCLADWSGGAVR